MLIALGGCDNRLTCLDIGYLAIRATARDAQTSQVIKFPTVTVTYNDGASPFAGLGPNADSTVTQIFGSAGLYRITARKSGYTDAVQAVEVEALDACGQPRIVDVTFTLSRIQ